ncbi:MAG TPA: AtpZ/AtpI family protein [Firmicutes bacterium]|jgi:F0F1-type ATP synthase assembly protein I|nr:AtpZ/AtpI family protein [Bacillota bacterium]
MFDSDKKLAEFLRSLSRYTGLTLRPAAGVIAGFFGGRYLDNLWETGPLLATAGVLAGLVLGLVALYREAAKELKKGGKKK